MQGLGTVIATFHFRVHFSGYALASSRCCLVPEPASPLHLFQLFPNFFVHFFGDELPEPISQKFANFTLNLQLSTFHLTFPLSSWSVTVFETRFSKILRPLPTLPGPLPFSSTCGCVCVHLPPRRHCPLLLPLTVPIRVEWTKCWRRMPGRTNRTRGTRFPGNFPSVADCRNHTKRRKGTSGGLPEQTSLIFGPGAAIEH